MKWRTLVIVVLPALVVLGVFATAKAIQSVSARALPQQPPELVPAPTNWVPFSADFRGTGVLPGGEGSATVGKFYRNSDGSERLETRIASRAGLGTVNIKNIPESHFYVFMRDRGWTVQPMILKPTGHKPSLYPVDTPGLRRSDTIVDGFDTYELVNSNTGTVRTVVPALNFFEVLREGGASGNKLQYNNIRLEEPPSELFRPPLGVAITEISEPGGIVYQQLR